MADFSLTTLFVLPVGNTLPTTGSTENLNPTQLGVFNADYTVSTAGNISNQPYIYIAQGRKENIPDVGTKRSDKINKNKVTSWYKLVAEPDVLNQSTSVHDWHVSCGEQVTVTIRAHSNYLDTGFFNGYTQSVTVEAPCCDCGENPCDDISAADTEALIDAIIAKLQVAGPFLGGVLNQYISAFKVGTGASTQLVLQGKPLTPDGRICDLSANPWEYDRLWYHVFVQKGAASTQDRLVYDRCDQIATVTVNQRSSYVRGSSEEIYHLEKYYYSYQSPAFKALVDMPGYNGAFESYVVDGQFYDTYYVTFLSQDNYYTWDNALPQDETVILAVPSGQATALETLLTVYLGAPKDVSPTDRTTTTTTSTTSTTTTTTTTLIP